MQQVLLRSQLKQLSPVRKSRTFPALLIAVSALIVLVDQVTKELAEKFLTDKPVQVFGEVLQFRLAYNDAAAFSLGFGQTWILALISTISILLLLWFGPKASNAIWLAIAALVLGGATGNWIDRVFREPGFLNGHVVDFIQIPMNFPIFNVADISLVTGVALAILRVLLGDEIGGRERK